MKGALDYEYFGNRGFFPETLIAGAREEVAAALKAAGHYYLIPDADMTRYGAVETREEGRSYAAGLKNTDVNLPVRKSSPNFPDAAVLQRSTVFRKSLSLSEEAASDITIGVGHMVLVLRKAFTYYLSYGIMEL